MEELIPIFFFLSVAAVLILRPITKKIGLLLEAVAKSKMGVPQDGTLELTRMRSALEQLSKRLDLIDDRQDFTERLMSSAQRRAARTEAMAGGRMFEPQSDPEYLAR